VRLGKFGLMLTLKCCFIHFSLSFRLLKQPLPELSSSTCELYCDTEAFIMLLPLVILVGIGVVYVLVTHVQLIIFLHPPMPQNNPVTYNVVLQKDGKTRTYSSAGNAGADPSTALRGDGGLQIPPVAPMLEPAPPVVIAPVKPSRANNDFGKITKRLSEASECKRYEEASLGVDLFYGTCDVGNGLGVHKSDPAECCALCNSDANCGAFIYGYERCWIKNCGESKSSTNNQGLVTVIKKHN
jgi:hypothetical protein